ncbi:MAG: HAD family phosphatase [Bacteroidota bacterium]
MQRFQAVLSDLDGTLVDSEPIHGRAWLDILAKYGLHFDERWFDQWIGTSDRFLAEAVIKEHQLPIRVRELQREKEVAFHAAIEKEGKVFPGVEAQLKKIKKLLPIAIVTNSGRKDAEFAFRATKIDQYAELSVTASDVRQMKPAPEPYFQAAEALGVNSKQCIAIEDSPAGSYSAMSAGCYVIGIHHGNLRKELHAEEVVQHPWEAFGRVLEMLGQEATEIGQAILSNKR